MRLLICTTLAVLLGTIWAHPKKYFDVSSSEVQSKEHGQRAGQKATNCSCGWTNKARIVGGRETFPNEYPLMAGLMDVEKKGLYCGAAIVTINHAITAAHCTHKYKDKAIALVVGAHNVSSKDEHGADVVPISRIIEHESYNPKSFHNDISLLILERSLTFTQTIGPACLPTIQLGLVNEYVKILGWGRVLHQGDTSSVLRKVDVRVLSTDVCANKYLRNIPIDKPFQKCTFGKKRDSCQGDSGGPVIWLDPETNRYTLIGAVSYGKVCGGKVPAVNTDIAYFINWIQKSIADSGLPGATCSKVD